MALVTPLPSDLGFGDWKCGCPTAKRSSCRNPIAKQKHPGIQKFLQIFSNRIQSDPALHKDLEELAKQVHCHRHQTPTFYKARIRDWLVTFPEGPAHDLATRVDRILRKTFGDRSTKCAAQLNEGRECMKNTGGLKVQSRIEAEKQIQSPETFMHPIRLEACLRTVDECRFCRLHGHMSDPVAILKAKKSIQDLYPDAIASALEELGQTQEGLNSAPTRSPALNTAPISSLEDEEAEDYLRQARRPGHASITRSPSPESGVSSFVDIGPDETPLNIVKEEAPKVASPESMRKLLFRHINISRDSKPGVVYCYAVEENPGFVKIGYTTRTAELRREEWEFDCNRRIRNLHPNEEGAQVTVRYPGRVEALCHEELKEYNVKVECSACMKQHQEWYAIDAKIAIATIQKWSRWIDEEPYSKGQDKHPSLKKEWRDQMSNIQTFIQDPALKKNDGITVADR